MLNLHRHPLLSFDYNFKNVSAVTSNVSNCEVFKTKQHLFMYMYMCLKNTNACMSTEMHALRNISEKLAYIEDRIDHFDTLILNQLILLEL